MTTSGIQVKRVYLVIQRILRGRMAWNSCVVRRVRYRVNRNRGPAERAPRKYVIIDGHYLFRMTYQW